MVKDSIEYLMVCLTPENKSWLNWKSIQGNQGYSGNKRNAIQGQRPDMENRHTQQRT